jgi:hypothetical protein
MTSIELLSIHLYSHCFSKDRNLFLSTTIKRTDLLVGLSCNVTMLVTCHHYHLSIESEILLVLLLIEENSIQVL